ncbi:uncharacterized protein LOC121837877 [Ixodes scapularis]|uniref:uncharacterized protein LOC121837877 n=1 Tax=Ixodes scapularis TaxID=6945 RepID=UPI001C3822CD|nr:uncharacterized protein LOC121837877 [Ixodes scapularis]
MTCVLTKLKSITENWQSTDRVCTLMFDEISLRRHLQYDIAHDVVIGFEDDGTRRTKDVGSTALVILLAGIVRNWVQPVAFAISKRQTNSSAIRTLLIGIIEQLQEAGITVKAVICDQGTNNVSLAGLLNVSTDEPFFEVKGTKVYFLYDTPHLMKCTRNNLRAHKLQIGSETIDWTYIETLFKVTHDTSADSIAAPNYHLKSRLAKKLTERHIYRKPFSDMRVKYATQVMSESVAVALLTLLAIGELPAAAKPTADFLERMDKLFDCLNSSVVKQPGDKLRYAIKEQSEHASFLEQCLPWIDSWRFGSADKRQPHTIKGWQVTIKAVLLLWGELHQDLGFDSLLTRRDDTSFLLAELSTFPVSVLTTGAAQLGQASGDEAVQVYPSVSDTSPEVPDIVKDNVVYYVSGSLVKSFLRSKSADCVCERFLTDEGPEQLHGSHQFYSLLAANNVPESLFGDLTAPSDACYEYVQQLEARFLKKIDSLIHLGEVCQTISKTITSETAVFCSKECHERFVNMFANTRLGWYLKFRNQSFHEQKSKHSVGAKKMRKLAH